MSVELDWKCKLLCAFLSEYRHESS